jgi:hypothetical protein
MYTHYICKICCDKNVASKNKVDHKDEICDYGVIVTYVKLHLHEGVILSRKV